MEGILKFLVVLVVIAGIVWVVSPILSNVLLSGAHVPPDLTIGNVDFGITPLEDTACATNMCEFRVTGKLYNSGGAAKNILLTIFFDKLDNNLGSINMPLIGSVESKQTMDLSYVLNYSCDANGVRPYILSFSE